MPNWRPISGAPLYEVSDTGEVRSWAPWRGSKTPRLLKQNIVAGHCQVVILVDDKRRYRYVHHLVLEAFVGQCPDGLETCHENGIATDNNLSNLRWDTHASNGKDTARHGSLKGEKSGAAKLTDNDIRKIRNLLLEGYSQRRIASLYGLGKSTVGSIKRNENWRHI